MGSWIFFFFYFSFDFFSLCAESEKCLNKCVKWSKGIDSTRESFIEEVGSENNDTSNEDFGSILFKEDISCKDINDELHYPHRRKITKDSYCINIEEINYSTMKLSINETFPDATRIIMPRENIESNGIQNTAYSTIDINEPKLGRNQTFIQIYPKNEATVYYRNMKRNVLDTQNKGFNQGDNINNYSSLVPMNDNFDELRRKELMKECREWREGYTFDSSENLLYEKETINKSPVNKPYSQNKIKKKCSHCLCSPYSNIFDNENFTFIFLLVLNIILIYVLWIIYVKYFPLKIKNSKFSKIG